jgi:hypothetical protein
MRFFLLVPILLLGLAGCGADPDKSNAANAQASAMLPSNSAAPEPGPAKAEAASAPLLLDGKGLTLVERDGGATRLVAFDAPMSDTVQALTRALGRAPDERGTNDECGGGSQDFAEWKGDVTAWFAEDRFVGWDSKGEHKTAEGIGIGSRRSAMPHFQVENSSLGTEFTGASGLYGLLDSPAPQAKVTALWAGSTCIFR